MPDADQEQFDLEALEAMVDTMMSEIEAACASMDAASEPPTIDPASISQSAFGDLSGEDGASDDAVADQVTRMLEEAASSLGITPEASSSNADAFNDKRSGSTDHPDELAELADAMLADANAAADKLGPGKDSGTAAAKKNPVDLDQLDDDLANLSSSMTDFDLDEDTGPPPGKASATAEQYEPSSYLPRFDDDDDSEDLANVASPDFDDEPAVAAEAPIAPESEPEPAPEAESGRGPATPATADTIEPKPPRTKLQTIAAGARATSAAGAVVFERVEPIAKRGAIAASKPLDGKSAALRQTLGWFGLYTAFLGICVMVWAGFVRDASTPATEIRPTELTSDDSPTHSATGTAVAGVDTGD